MRKRFLGWVVMGAFVGVAMSIFMGPVTAQTVQAELKRIAQEIYSVEEGLADLELRAKGAQFPRPSSSLSKRIWITNTASGSSPQTS